LSLKGAGSRQQRQQNQNFAPIAPSCPAAEFDAVLREQNRIGSGIWRSVSNWLFQHERFYQQLTL
jgi:hypothetical protein